MRHKDSATTVLADIKSDMLRTEELFYKSNSKTYREAINKLRYILIVTQHELSGYEMSHE